MAPHSLYGWAVSDGEVPRIRFQIPPEPSQDGVPQEIPFRVQAPPDPCRSLRYDYANDLTYAQTMDRDGRLRQVLEVSPCPSDPRPARLLQCDNTTFSAVAFGPATGGPAPLYAADPANARLYQLGPPAGTGAQASRNGTWTAFHDLEGQDIWAQYSIADLAVDVIEGHGNEPVSTAFILSGPTFQEQEETYLLIKPLQDQEGPAPEVLKIPAQAQNIGVDPYQSYVWLSGANARLCRVYLESSHQVEQLDFTCAGPAVFMRARDTVWVVFMANGTRMRGVDTTGRQDSFSIAAEETSVGDPLIATGGGDRAWTVSRTDHGPSLYEWDITQGTCTDVGVLSVPYDIVLAPDFDYR
ncbi:hypothetical protein ACFVUW_11710 [Streptomyces xiamenensis]|uniref:hypothetical protein n=1 Tax=Streptomyces xiamenensis TaxID=408015 RepID=UPI0036F16915